MTEEALKFGSEGSLVGVQCIPVTGVPEGAPAFIFINAGLVHRVGPSRMYVRLARSLAEIGIASVRFDCSGIGDSPIRNDGLPFDEGQALETGEVMDQLSRRLGVRGFVLIGLCSGAIAAFNALCKDPRVVAAVMINPQGFVHDREWNTFVRNKSHTRDYWSRLFDKESWRRALTGQSQYLRFVGVMLRAFRARLGKPQVVQGQATAIAERFKHVLGSGKKILVVCSDGDHGIDYLDVILDCNSRKMQLPNLTVEVVPRADHTMTPLESQRQLLEIVSEWAAEFAPRRDLPVG